MRTYKEPFLHDIVNYITSHEKCLARSCEAEAVLLSTCIACDATVQDWDEREGRWPSVKFFWAPMMDRCGAKNRRHFRRILGDCIDSEVLSVLEWQEPTVVSIDVPDYLVVFREWGWPEGLWRDGGYYVACLPGGIRHVLCGSDEYASDAIKKFSEFLSDFNAKKTRVPGVPIEERITRWNCERLSLILNTDKEQLFAFAGEWGINLDNDSEGLSHGELDWLLGHWLYRKQGGQQYLESLKMVKERRKQQDRMEVMNVTPFTPDDVSIILHGGIDFVIDYAGQGAASGRRLTYDQLLSVLSRCLKEEHEDHHRYVMEQEEWVNRDRDRRLEKRQRKRRDKNTMKVASELSRLNTDLTKLEEGNE